MVARTSEVMTHEFTVSCLGDAYNSGDAYDSSRVATKAAAKDESSRPRT
jgi:hypothetical protein